MKSSNTMKKFIGIIAMSSFVIVGGCTKLEEEPIGLLAPESFFKTPSDAEAAVMGSYSMLTRDYLYGRILPMTLQLLGDQVDIGDIGTVGRRIETNEFRFDPANVDYETIWSSLYLVIGAANSALDGIPGIEMDETKKNALLGEATAVRALAYYHLVQLFGDVPYLDEFVRDPDSVKEMTRTPASEVWGFIIQDLEYAITVLPDQHPGGVKSRATKGSAHTLLAKIHMIHGNWAEAAEHAEHVIQNAGTYGYALNPDYKALWDADLGDQPEHVWTADFIGGTNDYSNDNRASVDYNAPMTGVRDADMNGWSVLVASPGVYDFFPDGDYRKEVTFLTETEVDGVMTPYTEWTWSRIHYNKWNINPGANANSDGAQSDHNYIIFRYAEVLLMAAESLNELNNGPTPAAYDYINQVRERARNQGGTTNQIPADLTAGMSYEEFQKAVRDERTYELAAEWKRWYDIKRWGLLMEVFSGPDALETQNPAPYNLLLPVPQSEIGRNANLLPQNEGY